MQKGGILLMGRIICCLEDLCQDKIGQNVVRKQIDKIVLEEAENEVKKERFFWFNKKGVGWIGN